MAKEIKKEDSTEATSYTTENTHTHSFTTESEVPEAPQTSIDPIEHARLLEELAYYKKREAETTVAPAQTQSPEDVQAWLNERIPFEAFKDAEKYKDDIHVTVNGYTFVIQRGVQVMIPRYVYMALKDAERQNMIAAKHSIGLSNEFQNESKRLNVT